MNNEVSTGEQLLHNRKPIIDVFMYVMIFILIGLIIVFYFLAIIPIDGFSMENTLHNQQHIIAQRACIDVDYGDIVTINTAENNEEDHIVVKRIVALQGDKLVFMISEDRLTVNLYRCKANQTHFELMNEPYIKEPMSRNSSYGTVTLLYYTPWLTEINVKDPSFHTEISKIERAIITVPENSIYFLGDNRNNSKDSRILGTRTIDKITAKLLFII